MRPINVCFNLHCEAFYPALPNCLCNLFYILYKAFSKLYYNISFYTLQSIFGVLKGTVSQMDNSCALIKVDWLAACIAPRVVGALFVISLRRWRTICTVPQPMGSKVRHLKKCPKPS